MSIYEQHGYESREDYLISLADDHGVEVELVYELAGVLGSDEDFDGLVTEIEDSKLFNIANLSQRGLI